MNITIEAPFGITEQDRSIIESKINDLSTYESRMTQVNVFFKADDGKVPDAILAEIRVRVPGHDLFVSDTDTSAMTAFHNAYHAVKRQVKKRRDKLNDHHSPVREINEIVNNTY